MQCNHSPVEINPFLKAPFPSAPIYFIFGLGIFVGFIIYAIIIGVCKPLDLPKIKKKCGRLVGANTVWLCLKAGFLFLDSPLCNGCEKQENAFSR